MRSSGSTRSGRTTRDGLRRSTFPNHRRRYYYRNVYGCFINDPHGLESLDKVGISNVMCETDYPHSDSTWPDTRAIVTKLVHGLSESLVHQILRGNAIRLLGLGFTP